MSDEVARDVRDRGEAAHSETPRASEDRRPPPRERSDSRLPAERFSLVDSTYNRPKIIFQPGILAFLVISALVAFAVIGFLGYPSDDPGGAQFYFVSHPAWVLFVWFGAIALIVEWTIFGRRKDAADKVVLRWRWAVTIMTIACMLIEGIIYAQPRLLQELSSGGGVVSALLGDGRLLWNVVNFGVIVVYVVDRLWEWRIRLASPATATDATTDSDPNSSFAGPIRLAGLPLSKLELLSQDIFAGAVLCFALGLALQPAALNFALRIFPGRRIDSCTLSWALGACQGEGVSGNPPTLHTIDWVSGGSALVISLLILVIVLLVRIFYLFRDRSIPLAVLAAVWTTLRSLAILLAIFIPNLRTVIWPVLIAAGTTCIGLSARLLQMYLHSMSDQRTCGATGSCPDLREFSFFLRSTDVRLFQELSFRFPLAVLGLALILGIIGAFFMLLAVRVLLLNRVKDLLWMNWLRFVGVTTLIVVCTFWIMSLTLSALNGVLGLAAATSRVPFPQPGPSTIGSFAAFVIAVVVIIWRLRGSGTVTWAQIRGLVRGEPPHDPAV